MLRIKASQFLLLSLAASLAAHPARSQTLSPVNEIKLPVEKARGLFAGRDDYAHDQFQMKMLPDKSLLVFIPDASGQWPLVRIRKWWSKDARVTALQIPNWTGSDLGLTFATDTDLLITPDGRYAVAIATNLLIKHPDQVPFPPRRSLQRKDDDSLIVVIDPQQWRIVDTLHTASMDSAAITGALIVNGRWLALQGYLHQPQATLHERVSEKVNLLVSIPDLKPGARCVSSIEDSIFLPRGATSGDWTQAAESLRTQNDLACRELLQAAGMKSMRFLEFAMYLGIEPPPNNLVRQWLDFDSWQKNTPNEGSDAAYHDPDFETYYFRYFTQQPQDLAPENPPFESSSRLWYELRPQEGKRSDVYWLNKYDSSGNLLKSRPTDLESHSKCGAHKRCACAIEDVSEEQNSILTLCRRQHPDLGGAMTWTKQWLSVFNADDLASVGDIGLSKNMQADAILVSADGNGYVLVVDHGEILRVYRRSAG